MFCREVIIDISSTVVDESKEIVLIAFASISSNSSLRMTCMNVKCQVAVVRLALNEIFHVLFVAIVTVVDSRGRGLCVEVKYSLLEFSVPLFCIISQCAKGIFPVLFKLPPINFVGTLHEGHEAMRRFVPIRR